jgi:RNA polymerase sigma factor (sigma-70 family)
MVDHKQTADLRLEMRIKNNVLYRAVYDKYGSASNFYRQMRKAGYEFHSSEVGRLINFKLSPVDKKGNYTKFCEDLSGVLSIRTEDLFPRHLYEKIKVNKETIEISSLASLPSVVRQKINSLPAPAEFDPISVAKENESVEKIREVLGTLPERLRLVVELLYGFSGTVYTLKEAGEILKVTPSRVGQLELKALRLLQHPSRARPLEKLIEP